MAIALLVALSGCSSSVLPTSSRLGSYELQRLINRASDRSGVSSRLIAAVIQTESHGDPLAVSRSGARGLMQLMPDTARQYGVGNSFNAEDNVMGGSLYLRDLLSRYHQNVTLAVAAYNAGPGAVDSSHGVPSYPETQNYVARVNAAIGLFQ